MVPASSENISEPKLNDPPLCLIKFFAPFWKLNSPLPLKNIPLAVIDGEEPSLNKPPFALSMTRVVASKSKVDALITNPLLSCRKLLASCFINKPPPPVANRPVSPSLVSVTLSKLPTERTAFACVNEILGVVLSIINLPLPAFKLNVSAPIVTELPLITAFCDFIWNVPPLCFNKLFESCWKLNSPLPLIKIPLLDRLVGKDEPNAKEPPFTLCSLKVLACKSKVSAPIVTELPLIVAF